MVFLLEISPIPFNSLWNTKKPTRRATAIIANATIPPIITHFLLPPLEVFLVGFSASLLKVAFFQKVQVIVFEIDCAIFYANLHELFRQFLS